MEKFLKGLEISDGATQLYLKCLGESPLTYNELCTLIPESTSELSESTIGELVKGALIVQIEPKQPEILVYYQARPPIAHMLHYYENITRNLENITKSVQDLIQNTISQVFKKDNELEMDSTFEELQEIINDINEDALLQKQEVEDILQVFNSINDIKTTLTNLRRVIDAKIQKEFSGLIKTFSSIETSLINRIKTLDLKKKEDMIVEIIKDEFHSQLKDIIKDFSPTIHDIIVKIFVDMTSIIEKTIDSISESEKYFKMLMLDVINNFESKMKRVFDSIKIKKDSFDKGMQKLNDSVLRDTESIIQDSIAQVMELNKPMENVLLQYLEQITSTKQLEINNIWNINSRVKLKEEIEILIKHSEEKLTLIIPKIEYFFTIEQIQGLNQNIRINIASADPPTNSRVKKINAMKNIEFKNLPNNNVVILRGDIDHFIVGILQEDSKDPLHDVVGFGCNFQPLNAVLNKIIEKYWSAGKIETFQYSKKPSSQRSSLKQITSGKYSKVIQTPPPIQSYANELTKPSTQLETQPQQPVITQLPETPQQNIEPLQPYIPQNPVQIGSSGFFSQVLPIEGDTVGMMINNAFNEVIQNIDVLKGDQFSQELDKVAILILENRGFSVTLHNLRSCINNYKEYSVLLNEVEKKQIFEAIESWKQRLL